MEAVAFPKERKPFGVLKFAVWDKSWTMGRSEWRSTHKRSQATAKQALSHKVRAFQKGLPLISASEGPYVAALTT